MGGKKGGKAKLRLPTRYLLLNSSNSGRGMEGTRMLGFLPFGFCQQKTPRDITFLPRSIRKPANSSKKHHGRHELERSDCCPEDGRDGSHERGEGFGDVRRKKIGKCVPTKAEDKLKPRRAPERTQP